MIKIIETPQRSDYKIEHTITGDILTVTLNGITEEFDFTGMPEGRAEEITVEHLKINPVLDAEKVGDEITITLLRFYGEDEKEEFEIGEDQMGV